MKPRLRHHREVAHRALEIGATTATDNDFEAVRNAPNGCKFVIIVLRQAGHTRFAAHRAAQLFVPLIHADQMICFDWCVGPVPDRDPNLAGHNENMLRV